VKRWTFWGLPNWTASVIRRSFAIGTIKYVHQLESRLPGLPSELEAGLDPEQIAKLLGASLRQHFLNSGITDTVKGCKQPAWP